MEKKNLNDIATQVVNAAFSVHKELGPGLLESVYQICLMEELRQRKIHVRIEVFLPVVYKNVEVDKSLRLDLLVEEEIIVEVKAVEQLIPVHEAQLLTYLKLTGKWLGYLINFNVPLLKDGIIRRVNGYK